MTLQEEITALLHGDLTDEDRVAELMHVLAVSPEKRGILVEQIQLSRAFTMLGASIAPPRSADQNIWQGLDAIDAEMAGVEEQPGHASTPASSDVLPAAAGFWSRAVTALASILLVAFVAGVELRGARDASVRDAAVPDGRAVSAFDGGKSAGAQTARDAAPGPGPVAGADRPTADTLRSVRAELAALTAEHRDALRLIAGLRARGERVRVVYRDRLVAAPVAVASESDGRRNDGAGADGSRSDGGRGDGGRGDGGRGDGGRSDGGRGDGGRSDGGREVRARQDGLREGGLNGTVDRSGTLREPMQQSSNGDAPAVIADAPVRRTEAAEVVRTSSTRLQTASAAQPLDLRASTPLESEASTVGPWQVGIRDHYRLSLPRVYGLAGSRSIFFDRDLYLSYRFGGSSDGLVSALKVAATGGETQFAQVFHTNTGGQPVDTVIEQSPTLHYGRLMLAPELIRTEHFTGALEFAAGYAVNKFQGVGPVGTVGMNIEYRPIERLAVQAGVSSWMLWTEFGTQTYVSTNVNAHLGFAVGF